MPFVKVHIHFVWSPKNRAPFLATRETRQTVWQHMRENAQQKGIYVDFINGYSEHCHCLVSLGIDQTMSQVMQLIKGESSFWINKQGLCDRKFAWQSEYFAISVSESVLPRVRNYIKNQEEHHRQKPYQVEYDELIRRYGFQQSD